MAGQSITILFSIRKRDIAGESFLTTKLVLSQLWGHYEKLLFQPNNWPEIGRVKYSRFQLNLQTNLNKHVDNGRMKNGTFSFSVELFVDVGDFFVEVFHIGLQSMDHFL